MANSCIVTAFAFFFMHFQTASRIFSDQDRIILSIKSFLPWLLFALIMMLIRNASSSRTYRGSSYSCASSLSRNQTFLWSYFEFQYIFWYIFLIKKILTVHSGSGRGRKKKYLYSACLTVQIFNEKVLSLFLTYGMRDIVSPKR